MPHSLGPRIDSPMVALVDSRLPSLGHIGQGMVYLELFIEHAYYTAPSHLTLDYWSYIAVLYTHDCQFGLGEGQVQKYNFGFHPSEAS